MSSKISTALSTVDGHSLVNSSQSYSWKGPAFLRYLYHVHASAAEICMLSLHISPSASEEALHNISNILRLALTLTYKSEIHSSLKESLDIPWPLLMQAAREAGSLPCL